MPLLKVPHLPAWRKAAGLSQAELARRAGVSHSTVESLESAKKPTRARPGTRRRLGDALGIPPNWLLYPPRGSEEGAVGSPLTIPPRSALDRVTPIEPGNV